MVTSGFYKYTCMVSARKGNALHCRGGQPAGLAQQVNAVTITLDDNNVNPWLMVTIDFDKVCFVRANSRYIKPVSVSDK